METSRIADEATDIPRTLDVSTTLAFERTRAAYERTMMSWVRTATSLIVFGFSVYKFFQLEAPRHVHRDVLMGPRGFALLLISIGIISLLLATIEYRRNIRALGTEYAGSRRSLAVFVAALISVVGILGLIAMVLRQ